MHQSDILSTFERFQSHLPIGGDFTLMILKGHLLIEEQILSLVQIRLSNPAAIKDAAFTSNQMICLAEALLPEKTLQSGKQWLWPAVKKLNKLRNDIAHNISKDGINDRVLDFVARVPENLESKNLCHNFEYALWITCQTVHFMIYIPEAADFEVPPDSEPHPSKFANAP